MFCPSRLSHPNDGKMTLTIRYTDRESGRNCIDAGLALTRGRLTILTADDEAVTCWPSFAMKFLAEQYMREVIL